MTNQEWYDHYKNKVNSLLYEEYIKEYYRPFWEYLTETIKCYKFTEIHEVGCGIGSITKILAQQNLKCNFACSDINHELLKLTNLNSLPNYHKIRLVNVLNPIPKTYNSDLIFSHGLLEHFSTSEMHKIIDNLNDSCKKHIHYVPTDKYQYKSIGDERLLSIKEWEETFNPEEIITFNKGYDLILIFNPLSNRIKS